MIAPYYQDEFTTLYCGDCREILPELERVDLVLTDPPYGIGIAANPVRQKFEKRDWDNQAPDADVLESLLKAGAEQIIWGGNYFPLPPSQGFLIWDKQQPENFSLGMCEFAWMSIQRPAKIYRERVVGFAKHHPTQKSLGLMKWCISFAPTAHTILDPFAGSGTTLRAAKDLGIESIGIEIEEKDCEIAAKRLRQEVLWSAMAR